MDVYVLCYEFFSKLPCFDAYFIAYLNFCGGWEWEKKSKTLTLDLS